ncbi:hypothetical protein D3C71_1458550 [compost metagenome]
MQQREQFFTAGRAQDSQADSAQIEIIEGRQLFADGRRILAFQPEFRRCFVAPVVERALTGAVGFNVIQPRQTVFHPLNQRCPHVFTLPGFQHLLAKAVGTERGHIVDGKCFRRDLSCNINRSIQRIATKTTANFRAFL